MGPGRYPVRGASSGAGGPRADEHAGRPRGHEPRCKGLVALVPLSYVGQGNGTVLGIAFEVVVSTARCSASAIEPNSWSSRYT